MRKNYDAKRTDNKQDFNYFFFWQKSEMQLRGSAKDGTLRGK